MLVFIYVKPLKEEIEHLLSVIWKRLNENAVTFFFLQQIEMSFT